MPITPISTFAKAPLRMRPAAPPCPKAHDKWALHRALTVARPAFGLSDRALTVLSALLSFLPENELSPGAPLVVYPSNKTLARRANGMAESTLRRHLAALCQAGILARCDSPNGKRFARRGADGAVAVAYGFDLSPLLETAGKIFAEASRLEALELERVATREACVLLLRDLSALLAEANDDALEDKIRLTQRTLRRKLPLATLTALQDELATLRDDLIKAVEPTIAPVELSVSDSQIERHKESREKDSFESDVSLGDVLEACPDIEPYAKDGIRSWYDLVATACFVSAMMGISANVWMEAVEEMGEARAAITVAAMLQRVETVKNPGGYLRDLGRKARAGVFRPEGMILALLPGSRLAA